MRGRRVELAWFAFAVANIVAMVLWETWETVPFHFIWVSLTLVYGFRVWRVPATTPRTSLGCRTPRRTRSCSAMMTICSAERAWRQRTGWTPQ